MVSAANRQSKYLYSQLERMWQRLDVAEGPESKQQHGQELAP